MPSQYQISGANSQTDGKRRCWGRVNGSSGKTFLEGGDNNSRESSPVTKMSQYSCGQIDLYGEGIEPLEALIFIESGNRPGKERERVWTNVLKRRCLKTLSQPWPMAREWSVAGILSKQFELIKNKNFFWQLILIVIFFITSPSQPHNSSEVHSLVRVVFR